MPDTFSVSFILAGMYYGCHYLAKTARTGHFRSLMLYMLLVMVGTLAKLPAAYLLAVFAIPMLNKDVLMKRKGLFVVASLVSIAPALLWYFYWVPYLVDTYHFWHFFMGKPFLKGLHEIAENMPKTAKNFYQEALRFVGFALFLVGLIYAIVKKHKLLIAIFCLSFFPFLIVMCKAGDVFSNHSYYIIPFVPVMALLSGYGLQQLNNKKMQVVLLLAIGIEGILNQYHDFRLHPREIALLNLENDLNKVSLKTDLILINSGQYPTSMYFAHRKGWIESNEKIKDEQYLHTLQAEGLKYIVILKKIFGTTMRINLPIVAENDDYCIYKIVPDSSRQ